MFPWCKPCKAAYQIDYIRHVPKEARAAQHAAWKAQRDADREARARFLRASSSYSLKKRYGITPHQVVELATFQGEVCAICGRPPDMARTRGALHVDHDHTTGTIRGLLCEACNVGLGFFRDSPDSLAAAIQYLRHPPASQVTFTDPLPKPSFEAGRRNPEKSAVLELMCKQCGRSFSRKAGEEFRNRAQGKEGPFCSQRCSGTWSQAQQKVVGLIHGTTTGYTFYKCRCPRCKKSHADAERDRQVRKSRASSATRPG